MQLQVAEGFSLSQARMPGMNSNRAGSTWDLAAVGVRVGGTRVQRSGAWTWVGWWAEKWK